MASLIILLIIPLIANVVLGFLVITQRPRTLQNTFFFVAALAITMWATSSFLTDNASTVSLKEFFAYMTYGAALLSISALHWFSTSFRYLDLKNQKLLKFTLVFGIVGSVISATPLVVGGIKPTPEYTEVIPGPFFVFYILTLAGMFLITAWNMISVIRNPMDDKHKNQAKHIVTGTGLSFCLILVTNAIYPALSGDWSSAKLGPLLTVFLVGSTTYSIVRHQLFDIRKAAARALGYLASIISILLIYLAIILVLSNTDLLGANLSTLQRLSFATIAVLSGLLFTPFKFFYDKLTNKLFFRDAYDPQELLDELSNTLVSSVDTEEMLTKISLLVQENLKTSFATFFIRSTSYFSDRIIGAHNKDPTNADAEKIQELASKLHKKVIYVEDEPSSANEEELANLLKKNDIEILVRIVSTIEYEVKGIGYIFMGPKRSGGPYSKQDLKLLEIISNELVIAVENVLRFEEIEQFNVTLQKKIDSATKELQRNNEKLLALDEAKDEFVSMASHQLRTPLTSIKGYISMVLEGDAGNINDTQKQMLGQALFSSQRMVYLISDLLNVSRLRTGKFMIETKDVYLPDLVDSEVSQLIEGAKAKNITMSFTKPKKFATLKLDDMKIRQVVMNFVDNAIYYTPSGGKITVSLKETTKTVEFTVKDTGIGVPKAQLHKLFTKFYRADNARKARPDGTGLGLFMAKKVIVAQGGSLIIDSTENKGSTFGFTFPKDKLEVKDEKATK